MGKPMGPKSWVTGWHWRERVLNFEPSWFISAMSTGALMQSFVNFPYPITGGPRWLRDIGYILWIIDIVLFVTFSLVLMIRYIQHPVLLKKNIIEFPTSSYLGAIPISLNTIIIGLTSYYNARTSAIWAAFGIWWLSLVLSLLVGIGLVTIQTMRTPSQSISDIAGLWIMTSVPLFTLAGAGSTILPYLSKLNEKAALTVLIISWLIWSWAFFLLLFIESIYLFRLLAYKLPGPSLLASSFLPVAAISQAAFAFQNMSIYLASYIRSGYAPTQDQPPPLPQDVLRATAETIHWIGIIGCLAMLAQASFWLFQATAAILYQFPKQFNIGLWAVVFPWASYANAWAFVSRDLRDNGMRGWAATNTVIVTLLWLFCAAMTVWRGFWQGKLFTAPGLEEWLQEEKGGQRNGEKEEGGEGQGGKENGQQNGQQNGKEEDKQSGQQNGDSSNRTRSERRFAPDGTYEMERPNAADEEGPHRRTNGARSAGEA